ncbi:glycoside hydrolase family 20 zincin-like fold domain-containing protein [Naasia aerilata]|uniref:Beta-hexosaminidase bacterial type N-terminal domain-containing protein n=1 Tax=Naasia aerilata TaxID=1162966 RepID=A0ABM8GEL7_9MICO|nr:glycoside hydrolase family 20 zincin-like fold domain-containing protein [Naasia aerilata]BDZ46778.1 hypothetical protein GCM10025866_26870 [Naasia aerilata]
MSDATLGLVPQPRSLERRKGSFLLSAGSQVTHSLDESLPREGYVLEISASGVAITGGSEAGVFYGTRTLLQLLPPERLSSPTSTAPSPRAPSGFPACASRTRPRTRGGVSCSTSPVTSSRSSSCCA